MKSLEALIPVDGSTFSRSVIPFVTQLLNPEQYTLTLLRVGAVPVGIASIPERPVGVEGWSHSLYESPQQRETTRHSTYATELWESAKAELLASLSDDAKALKQAGFKVVTSVRFGDPAEEIIDYVERHPVDLVVMATHGRTGLNRVLMGSVAEKVLRALDVPVMMQRPVDDDMV